MLISVAQMAKYLETVYVSGWQCSSTASTSNEPGPDLADYPMDTVPNKVLLPIPHPIVYFLDRSRTVFLSTVLIAFAGRTFVHGAMLP